MTAPLVGSEGMPLACSPGVATIGRICVRSIVCTPPAYWAPGSGRTTLARRASSDVPGRRAVIHRSVSSSASTTPALAEHSVAMLARVARSSGESDARPGPPNSITRSSVACCLACVARICSITSLAVTPLARRPTSSKRMASGTSTNVKPACTSAAYSVAPTP